jgi:hypothetical protein
MRYILHPEYIISKSDCDSHYISFCELINLYQLNSKDCIRYNPDDHSQKHIKNAVHLYPLYHGNYLEFKSRIS